MTTELNEPQPDMQQHRAPKRVWSAPRVIEQDLTETQVSPRDFANPTDSVYSAVRYGPS